MDYTERQTLRNRKVNITMSIPLALLEVIDRLADAEQESFARTVTRLLRAGLEVERNKRAAKFAVTSTR